MNQELQTQLTTVVNHLATSLQTTSEHVYSVLIKQMYVSVIDMALLMPLGVLGMYMSLKMYRYAKSIKTCEYDNSEKSGGYALALVIFAISYGLFAHTVIGICTRLLNPEYAALMHIIDKLTS